MAKKDPNTNSQNDVEKLAFYFQKIMRALHKYARDILLELNFSLPHYYALSLLGKAEKGKKYRMSDLKEDLAITGAYATGIADYLIEKKLARRGRWGGDRRVVMIEITDEGKSFLKEIKNRRKKFLSGLLNRIKQEDIKRILESLDILYSAVLKYSEKKDA